MTRRAKILLVLVGLMVVFALAVPVQAGPPVRYWHATAGLIDLSQPLGTQWHELYPTFCRNCTLTSWEDNGDGILSSCDTIDVQRPDGGMEWYHVENVTITLNVTLELRDTLPDDFYQPMYIELKGGYNESALTNPIGTLWHEIYPNFCTSYNLTGWTDNGGNKLDYCDYIWLMNEDDAEVEWEYHVEEVAIDIVVSQLPPPAVGGEAYLINKTSLLAPWIAVGVLLAGSLSWYILRRRRAQA